MDDTEREARYAAINNGWVGRLKASRNKEHDYLYKLGVLHGERWAKHYADYDELQRLHNIEPQPRISHGQSVTHYYLFDGKGLDKASVVKTVAGKEEVDVNSFWAMAAAENIDKIERSDFIEGFVSAACQVYIEFTEDG